MAYDETLALRLRKILSRRKAVVEKKMFGGLGFMLHGNMLVGVWKKWFIARLGADAGKVALDVPFVKPMDLTGKPMKGWIFVDPGGLEGDDQLRDWIARATKYVSALPKKN